ncbi:unnamed protein product [Diamesa tonsa]
MDQLPTESLVKIFTPLDGQSLINASEVCKKFQFVINNFMPIKFPSVRIDFQYLTYSKVHKFSYKDGSSKRRDFNCMINGNRMFQNFTLVNLNKEATDRLGNKWLQLFKKQINTRCLRIKSDCMDLNQLSMLMKLTHRLVFLEIDGYRLSKTEQPLDESDVAHLPSLKHLKIKSFLDASAQLFLIFKECKTLKTISLHHLMFTHKKMKSINDFLCHQKALEVLELIDLDSHQLLFTADSTDAIRFQLKKLYFIYNGYSVNFEKFSNFLCHQHELKDIKLTLDLRNSIMQSQDVANSDLLIKHLMTLQNLTTLNILVNKYSMKDIEDFKYKNKKVTTLIFENENRSDNDLLVALLKSFPKLNHLELACEYTDEVLKQLSHLKKLKHLKLTDYYLGLLKNIKCHDLESISLQYCYAKHAGSDWVDFLKHNKNIKKINIHHSIDFIDDVTIEVITRACPNLEVFQMTDSSSNLLTEIGWKTVRDNCKHIKLLKLTDIPGKKVTQDFKANFGEFLANVKCVVLFYILCIVLFCLLVVLMWQGTI